MYTTEKLPFCTFTQSRSQGIIGDNPDSERINDHGKSMASSFWRPNKDPKPTDQIRIQSPWWLDTSVSLLEGVTSNTVNLKGKLTTLSSGIDKPITTEDQASRVYTPLDDSDGSISHVPHVSDT